VKLHAKSKRKSYFSPALFDLRGIVVETSVNALGWQMLITDRSGLVLRVESFDTIVPSLPAGTAFPILILRSLRLMEFDSLANCAVAEFISDSSCRENISDPSVKALHKWKASDEGSTQFYKLTCYISNPSLQQKVPLVWWKPLGISAILKFGAGGIS
jgi:hypothetical protein